MAISRDIQNHLAKGDYAALEGEWLTSLEEDPTDLDYFVGVARALVGNGQEGRARDLLEMLDEQPRGPAHVLRRKIEEPAALKALPPPQLLRAVLESYGRPLTAGEIRDVLHGIVGESQWTSWWGAARKHPQVVTSGTGRQTYHWAETSGDAPDSVWKAFQRAGPGR